MFKKTIDCTGIILAKLDGTAKGGAIFGVKQKLNLPVKFVGLGEGIDDLAVVRSGGVCREAVRGLSRRARMIAVN